MLTKDSFLFQSLTNNLKPDWCALINFRII